MRRSINIVLAALMSLCVWAEPVTPEQAQQYAFRLMEARQRTEQAAGQNMPRKHPALSEWKAAPLFDARNRQGQPCLYAVQAAEQDGFVLVSGDDRFAPVLGYGDQLLPDEQQMPDNMRAWLQGYIDEMRYLDSVGYQSSVVSDQSLAVSDQKEPIAPLIATTWNQSTPCNDLCPLDNNGKRSVTGCVATAMAQVINYHIQHYNAPTSIIADIPAYTTKAHSLSVSAVPAGTSLPDKSLLVNSYKGTTATDAQKTAVAQLMLYCGTAVQMNYTSSSSGASSSLIPGALIDYFGFDGTTRQVKRANYTYAGWMDCIYAELAVARPVCYRGGSSGGAHAFVIDGYDGNALFHVNWGWGGSSDGYFALSVLNPDDDGQIGASASSDGYNIDQAAVIGIQINTGETLENPVYLTTSKLRVDGQDVIFAAYNHTGETYSFHAGIGFIDDAGNITHINHSSYNDLQDNYGYSSLTRTVPTNKSYANQTKKIVPISRKASILGGKWYTGSNPDMYYYTARYDANGVPTLTAHPDIQFRVDTIYVPTSKYVDEMQSVKVSVTNTGDEYYGKLYLFISLADTLGEAAAELGLTALESSTQTVSFEWKPEQAGTYNLWVASDSKGKNVMASSSVTVKEDASLQGRTLAIVDYTFENLDKTSIQVDDATGIRSMDVYGTQLKGKIKVKNMTDNQLSSYQVKVLVEKYNEQTGQFIPGTWNSYYTLNLSPGYTTNLSLDRTLEADQTYRICVVLRNSPSTYLDDRYVVHMRSSKPVTTGIDQITNDQSPMTNKVIKDGHLIILRNGKQYTVHGQLIR